ncbi:MAG: secondary thiamine-phosphate synthase enzyme [Thermoleophilia bacterium]|nr:secondary thiamine-phosphate synthase enzyme [Thermoleophilia bacterium]
MTSFTLDTSEHQQFIDVTDRVVDAAGDLAGVGALVVASQHTTAAIIVNEGFDPDVTVDLGRALTPLADRDDYDHDEGNSDAHVKVALLGAAQLVPVVDGALALGRWQRIFFCEFDGPRDGRTVVISRLAGA